MAGKTKRCSRCKRRRALKHFHREGNGHQRTCKSCRQVIDRGPEARAAKLLNSAKARAQKADLPFNLTKEWVNARLAEGVCEVTGAPFVFCAGRHPHAPTIDRKDPRRGYTKANSRLVIQHLNVALSDWGDDACTALTLRYLMTRIPVILERLEGRRFSAACDGRLPQPQQSAWR